MILRVLSILVTLAAAAGLWFAFDELRILRRTVLWEYRYLVFGIGAFLVLSLLEFLLGWIKAKIGGTTESQS